MTGYAMTPEQEALARRMTPGASIDFRVVMLCRRVASNALTVRAPVRFRLMCSTAMTR